MQRLKRWLTFNLMYLRRPPWDTGITPPELEAFCAVHPPGKALDLGCGTGTNVAYLARNGWQVVGIDFALRAVQTARRRLAWEGLSAEIRLGDASRTATHGADYDLVLDMGCLHGLDEAGRKTYFSGLTGLLAAGGTFLLYTHLKDEASKGPGLCEEEIAGLSRLLVCVGREDSLDRWGRRAAWIEFRRDEA